MTVKKVVKKEVEEEVEEVEGEGADPRDEAKGLIREVVDEALEAWTKKNKPAPRKTHQDDATADIGWFESLFGAKP